MSEFDISKFTGAAVEHGSFRYEKNLESLRSGGLSTKEIEQAVDGAIRNIAQEATRSFVVYGEPQSGKTNMMIALTARLLDDGHRVIIVLLNDSVQLLEQNKDRFSLSGIDPSPKIFTEVLDPSVDLSTGYWVIFSKKNPKDLAKLIDRVDSLKAKVVIDDEADYASPNGKVNKNEKTKINELIEKLIGIDGIYIGVTATPARLDLNNTFENNNERWVDFPPHQYYTGQDVFFPMQLPDTLEELPYRLVALPDDYDDPRYLREALFSFMVNVAYLNAVVNRVENEQSYSILVHTSGKRADHTEDYKQIVKVLGILADENSPKFANYLKKIWLIASDRYPGHEDTITKYIKINIGRRNIVVMNSDSDKNNVGSYKSATTPSSLFTIAIGGNIVSRGVTFENLLSMFFTRDVKHKIQQDTYIQRARMFGTRGKYLEYFELHIPASLFLSWQRCFVFHRLSLAAIKSGYGSPVWLEDSKVAVASSASIDKSTVSLDSGEMSWQLFHYTDEVDTLISDQQPHVHKLKLLAALVGVESLPEYLLDFINGFMPYGEESLVIHATSGLENYSSADIENIQRAKGFMAANTLERSKYPHAIHHIKIFKNPSSKARVFYKYTPEIGNIRFLKNRRGK
jgi:hypothetical protein